MCHPTSHCPPKLVRSLLGARQNSFTDLLRIEETTDRTLVAPSLSPEFLLIGACAIWPPSDGRTEAIRAAAVRPIDWSRFLRIAKRHQMIGLIHDGLTSTCVEMPSEIASEIRARAATLARDHLALAAEAARLQCLFDKAGLPVLFLKGTSLALIAYGKLGLRSAKDIDLLVPFEALSAAAALLARAGYHRFDPPTDLNATRMRLLMPLRKDLGFVCEESGLRVELHWRLFLNPHAMDETAIMAASRIIPLTRSKGLRTLGEEDLFTYLCIHGALHWWYQLKWLADVGALLTGATERAERFYRGAEARGGGRCAAQALLLCRRVLGTPMPATLLKELGRCPKVNWLQRTALNAMTGGLGEREPRVVRFGTTRGSLSAFLLNQSWRYRLAELHNLLTNETDVMAVPLPERFRFLYPILRLPLWVWRHASWRDAR